jgi:hypothetical protein
MIRLPAFDTWRYDERSNKVYKAPEVNLREVGSSTVLAAALWVDNGQNGNYAQQEQTRWAGLGSNRLLRL